MPNANGLLTTMDSFLTGIRAEKQAELKKKAGGTGDGSDPSTHPVMKADNNTTPVTEGARGKENTADIKKDLGAAGVHGQEDSAAADKANPVDSIGTQKQGPDEVKGNVPTPKKPDTLVLGDKHASLIEKAASILESITKVIPAVKAAAAVPAPTTATPPAAPSQEDLQKTAAAQYPEDAENGYLAAHMLAESIGLVKSAETLKSEEETKAFVDAKISAIIKSAEASANAAMDYMDGMVEGEKKALEKKAALAKRAEGEMVPPEQMANDVPPEGGAGGPPPGMDAGGGGGGNPEIDAIAGILAQHGISIEELVAALQGGGDAGGEAAAGPGPEAGGAPPPPEADGMAAEKAAALRKTAAFAKNKAAIRSFLTKVATSSK